MTPLMQTQTPFTRLNNMVDMSKVTNKGLLDSLRGFGGGNTDFQRQGSSFHLYMQPKSIGNTPNQTLKDRLNLKSLQPMQQELQAKQLKHIGDMKKRLSLEDKQLLVLTPQASESPMSGMKNNSTSSHQEHSAQQQDDLCSVVLDNQAAKFDEML